MCVVPQPPDRGIIAGTHKFRKANRPPASGYASGGKRVTPPRPAQRAGDTWSSLAPGHSSDITALDSDDRHCPAEVNKDCGWIWPSSTGGLGTSVGS